jgi:hypothetical protein
LFGDIKTRIRAAQTRAALAMNAELVRLYWDIGRMIGERQRRAEWGTGVIPRLARDLRDELPELKGFSERNIKLMVQFTREYPTLWPTRRRNTAVEAAHRKRNPRTAWLSLRRSQRAVA